MQERSTAGENSNAMEKSLQSQKSKSQCRQCCAVNWIAREFSQLSTKIALVHADAFLEYSKTSFNSSQSEIVTNFSLHFQKTELIRGFHLSNMSVLLESYLDKKNPEQKQLYIQYKTDISILCGILKIISNPYLVMGERENNKNKNSYFLTLQYTFLYCKYT